MNRIDLEDNGFPVTAKTLRFLQETNKIAFEALARSYGNCILHGVVQQLPSGIYTDGAIIYNGEVLPFASGGVSGGYFRIVETSENAIYKNGLAIPAYFTRVAVAQATSANGGVLISSLERVNPIIPADTSWQNVVMGSNYQELTNLTDQVPQARIQNGKIEVWGVYMRKLSVGYPLAGTTYTIFTLPAGIRPVKAQKLKVYGLDYGGVNTSRIQMPIFATVSTSGVVTISTNQEIHGISNVLSYGCINDIIDIF
ncbi:MAG: hypothetical protein FWC39_07950 [Bacteroidetes bacterium]|nr:hypothetical protein [Bacteroidota bacterium]